MAGRARSHEDHIRAARDGRRIVLAVLMLIFVVATSLHDGRIIPSFAPAGSNGDRDDDLRTGSILITPPDGNVCVHRLIDNETWRIRPNGTVRCDAAVTWPALRDGGYTGLTRIEAIRDGFVSNR